MNSLTILVLSVTGVLSVSVAIRLVIIYGTIAIPRIPLFWFSIYFFLIHAITPLVKISIPKFRYDQSYDGVVLFYNAFLNLFIFLFVCLIAHPSRHFKKPVLDVPEFRQGSNAAIFAGLAMFVLGAYYAAKSGSSLTNSVGVEEFVTDRIYYSNQIGMSQHLSNLMIFGSATFLAGWLNKRRFWALIGIPISLVMLYSIFVYYSLTSSRNSILITLVFNGSVYFLYRKVRIDSSLRGVRNIVLMMCIGLSAIALGRGLTKERYMNLGGDHAEVQLASLWYSFLDGSFGNDENLLWLLEHGHPYYLGSTYYAGFVSIIPRSIWENKPWGAGPEIKNLIAPGTYVLGGAQNTSITTGMLTEGRMNWGFPGMIMAVLFWVSLTRYLANLAQSSKNILSDCIFTMLSVYMSTAFLYAEFLGLVSRAIFLFLLPAFFIIAISLVIRGNRKEAILR
ncbi:hypothetical protein [Rhodobacter ferrooxidans]|uniref:Oligosaccharide repeat unit polymerase n=1 Tax=Rhodobacter ferrooxidans TaxID=371731 RepID=C8RWW5_9RHOB|nr:hypothetical protein [Rhodobacter sp. SW2]EEW27058.1 hypothetical protein Rsw2DRAFT_0293 [Rhodobacter sp. SW2]